MLNSNLLLPNILFKTTTSTGLFRTARITAIVWQ